jgi:hypothetical protein
MIRVTCQCGSRGQVPPTHAGKQVKCRKCGSMIAVPRPTAPPPEAPSSSRRVADNPWDDIDTGPADESEAKLQSELPASFPEVPPSLGRPRFRVETPGFDLLGYKSRYLGVLGLAGVVALILSAFAVQRIVVEDLKNPGIDTVPHAIRMLCFTTPVLVLCVWLFYRSWRQGWIQAVVFTGGFVHYDGWRWTVWHWSDIASVRMQSYDVREMFYGVVQMSQFLTTHYRLRHRNGVRYEFLNTQGKRGKQFAVLVESESFQALYPTAAAQLAAGQSISFGPFGMEQGGVTYRGQLTPWSEIGAVSFQNGVMHIADVGKARFRDVDNAHVFLTLLEQRPERQAFRQEQASADNPFGNLSTGPSRPDRRPFWSRLAMVVGIFALVIGANCARARFARSATTSYRQDQSAAHLPDGSEKPKPYFGGN